MVDLSFIIVNYNSSEYVNKLVSDLPTFVQGIKYEVIIYDNGSTKPQKFENNLFLNAQENVKVIISKENYGFGGGCNKAAEFCSGEYLVILNPDTVLKRIDFQRLMALEKQNRIGLIGIQQCSSSGSPVYSFRPFPSIWTAILDLIFLNFLYYYLFQIKVNIHNKIHGYSSVQSISGAFIMISRSLFNHVNGFDTRYFMYVEESDLAFRLQKLGYKNVLVGNFILLHFQGKSVANYRFELENIHKNQIQFVRIHHGVINGLIFKIIQILNKLIRSGLYLIIGILSGSKDFKNKGKLFFKVALDLK